MKSKSGKIIFNSKEQFAKAVLNKLFEKSSISIFNFTTKKYLIILKIIFFNNNLFCKYVFGQKEKLAKINLKLNANNINRCFCRFLLSKNSIIIKYKKYYKNFQVAGAVGAAIGSIKQTVKILITKDQNEKYRVHFPSKLKLIVCLKRL